jgi:hypothetical protein
MKASSASSKSLNLAEDSDGGNMSDGSADEDELKNPNTNAGFGNGVTFKKVKSGILEHKCNERG